MILTAIRALRKGASVENPTPLKWAGVATLTFFDKAQTWRRDNPYLLQGARALSLTDEQLDTLFITAAGIEA